MEMPGVVECVTQFPATHLKHEAERAAIDAKRNAFLAASLLIHRDICRPGTAGKRYGKWAKRPNGTNHCKQLKKKTAGLYQPRRSTEKAED